MFGWLHRREDFDEHGFRRTWRGKVFHRDGWTVERVDRTLFRYDEPDFAAFVGIEPLGAPYDLALFRDQVWAGAPDGKRVTDPQRRKQITDRVEAALRYRGLNVDAVGD